MYQILIVQKLTAYGALHQIKQLKSSEGLHPPLLLHQLYILLLKIHHTCSSYMLDFDSLKIKHPLAIGS